MNDTPDKEKAFYTDISSQHEPQMHSKKATEKAEECLWVENERKNSKKNDVQICKHPSVDEAFKFEKSRIQELHIEDSYVNDINDEGIQKLREDVLKRFQEMLNLFEATATIIRVMAVLLLLLNVLEMIGIFFLLLYLSLKAVSSDQIILWVGPGLILSLFQMYLLIKAITVTQSKDVQEHYNFLFISVGFIIFCFFNVVLLFIAVVGNFQIHANALTEDAKTAIRISQSILLFSTSVKLIFQLVIVIFDKRQINNLNKMVDPSAKVNTISANAIKP